VRISSSNGENFLPQIIEDQIIVGKIEKTKINGVKAPADS
jgi:hypothetical protein